MRIVADTNVIVSAFLWGGVPRQLLNAAEGRRIELLTSRALIAELEDVLSRGKFAVQHPHRRIPPRADAARGTGDDHVARLECPGGNEVWPSHESMIAAQARIRLLSERVYSTDAVMTTLQLKLTLPDQLAKRAKKAGLLNAQSIETLLREAMRKKALARFLQVSERVAAAGVPAMSEEEIQAEVDAVRRARRKRLAPGR